MERVLLTKFEGCVYACFMKKVKVVIDTNVLIAALRSRRGASFKLLSLIGRGYFEYAVSVPLVIEYEEVALRQAAELDVSLNAIHAILDRLCFWAEKRQIFFLWRPHLVDPEDDMVLELAIESRARYILSYNTRDFGNLEQFGIDVLTPKEFLELIGVL
jgi:putative PIN family toxin of toxin-antitoxin system